MKQGFKWAVVLGGVFAALGVQAVRAESFELPPGNAFGWYAMANNQPEYGNVWRGVAQSFTALDERSVFSFFYVAPRTERIGVDLLLYAGEPGSLSGVTASRAWIEPGAANRRGVLDFDLSEAALAPGSRYTAVLFTNLGDLPPLGSDAGLGVQLASTGAVPNPYAGGSFFLYGFGGSDEVADRGWPGGLDMAFRLTPSAVPEPASLVLLLGGVAGLALRLRHRVTAA